LRVPRTVRENGAQGERSTGEDVKGAAEGREGPPVRGLPVRRKGRS
jgi:hypothetical protein